MRAFIGYPLRSSIRQDWEVRYSIITLLIWLNVVLSGETQVCCGSFSTISSCGTAIWFYPNEVNIINWYITRFCLWGDFFSVIVSWSIPFAVKDDLRSSNPQISQLIFMEIVTKPWKQSDLSAVTFVCGFQLDFVWNVRTLLDGGTDRIVPLLSNWPQHTANQIDQIANFESVFRGCETGTHISRGQKFRPSRLNMVPFCDLTRWPTSWTAARSLLISIGPPCLYLQR